MKKLGYYFSVILFVFVCVLIGQWLPFWKALTIDGLIFVLGMIISFVYRP